MRAIIAVLLVFGVYGLVVWFAGVMAGNAFALGCITVTAHNQIMLVGEQRHTEDGPVGDWRRPGYPAWRPVQKP